MPSDRWQRVKELLGAALERPAEAREAFLREACGSDEGLRREMSEVTGNIWMAKLQDGR